MRRILLLYLLAVAVVAGGTTTIAPPRAQSQDIRSLLTAPLRILRNLGVRGRVYHRRARARAAAPSRGREQPREVEREVARDVARETGRGLPLVYWPAASDDFFGFTFARGSDDAFWTHGPYDILTAAMLPGDAPRARKTAEAKSSAASPACAEESSAAERAGIALYEEIEQRVQPTDEQREAFKDLRSALIAAYQRIGSACGAPYANAFPPERLDLLADRLWAMRQAMLIVRTPLERVNNSLTDEQKARLDGAEAREASCAADLAAVEAWPGAEIVRAVHPSGQQQVALERLRLTFAGMAQWLSSSCPQQPLTSTLARLDAADERVNEMLYATRMIGRSLGGVYASLDERQEARLQSVGRQLRPARASDLGGR